MKKFVVIGHFAFGKESLNGQTIKTKVFTQALCEHLGDDAIRQVDTYGWSKHPFRFMHSVLQTVKQAENVVILPAHNGLRVLVPLLSAAVKRQKHCKLHYAVIGGWLPQVLQSRAGLAKQLQRFSGIYVETDTMKRTLETLGFQNVSVVPNFKKLPILKPEQLPEPQKPYKLCTFSRVMYQKGIEDAVRVVRQINEAQKDTVFTLDIYGPVDPEETAWFEELKNGFPDYIRYGGAVPFDKSVDVLKDYFALLFPTRFYTEGIPGTIIDAYAAGVPVISAKWESFADVVEDGVTGIGYRFEDIRELQSVLEKAARTPETVTALKKNCLDKAQDYLPKNVIEKLLRQMEGSTCGH